MFNRLAGACLTLLAGVAGAQARDVAPSPSVALLLADYAKRYDMPETLLRRIVKQESGFNPAARHGPYWGLMQLRLDTARGVGYRGTGAGLLDPDTNLTYGAAYLANAWRVSGGHEGRAMSLYRGGYYYEAKRRRLLDKLIRVP